MSRLRSHVVATMLALLIVSGMLVLPTMGRFTVQSLFTTAWLVLALLAFGAHVRQARLFVRHRSSRRREPDRIRQGA